MEPFVKKGKKRIRKAGGDEQPAQETENHPSLDYNSSYRDEEELVDYEPESPPRLSPGEDEIYSDYDQIPAQGDGPASNTPTTTDLLAFLAEGCNMRSRRRSRNVLSCRCCSLLSRAAGALDSSALDPRSPSASESIVSSGLYG